MTLDLNSSETPDDVAELPKLQQQVAQAVVEFNRMLAKVRKHRQSIDKRSAALADMREQFIRMRESVRQWDKLLWDMRWFDTATRDACNAAERQARTLHSLLDEVIWQLFDFRKRNEGGAKP